MAEVRGVVPRPVRIARICPVCVREEGRVPHRRFFFDQVKADEWRCPDHGQAVTQENKPYVKPPVVE